MNKLTYDAIQETIYEEKLDNGLQVFLLPKHEDILKHMEYL